MIGPGVNSLCIVVGALAGACIGNWVGEEFRKKLMLVFGCTSTGMGIFMIGKTQALPPVVCSLLLGVLTGELLRIEYGITALARKSAAFFGKFSGGGRAPVEHVQEQFSVFVVVFCASGLGFFGAMQEGLAGDHSLLLIKSLLDFPTALFITANTGAIIGVLAVPQFAVQALIVISAGFVGQYATATMLNDFSGCGGFIMLATGLRMCDIKQFPILSMLPALFFVMPLSALWSRFFPI